MDKVKMDNIVALKSKQKIKQQEKWAAALAFANEELIFQNGEKEKRAAELSIANIELAYQNEEKEKRAQELAVIVKELVFQNEEKEKRAAELLIANIELAFQNEEKEKRAAELLTVNKELLAFTYISSHDLQEPLRKIQTFISIIQADDSQSLSESGQHHFDRIKAAAKRMQQLIEDLLAFSRITTTELKFEVTNLDAIVKDVCAELKDTITENHATIITDAVCEVKIIPFQFRQLLYNLISNALKFSRHDLAPAITITANIAEGKSLKNTKLSPNKSYCHIAVKDNGIGFEPRFNERIFEVFQRLHNKEVYAGTGIGLAIVKKIVENHNGFITASSELNEGATFDIYIPAA